MDNTYSSAANNSAGKDDIPTDSPDMSSPVVTSLPTTADSRPESQPPFAAIPHFPLDMVATLKAEFAETLRLQNVGSFECEHLCVWIGKDVTQWKLAK